MLYCYTIIAELTREFDESELDNIVSELWSFKKVARINGHFGKTANYMFNVYDETTFNETNAKFGGRLRVYLEAEKRADADVANMAEILAHHDAMVVHYSCKLKVGGSYDV